MAPNYSLKPLTHPLTLHQPHMFWTVSKITHISAPLISRLLRVLKPRALLNVPDLWPAARLPSCSHSSGILMCHQPSSSCLRTPAWHSHKWPSLLSYVLSGLIIIIISIANHQRKGSIMLLTIAVTSCGVSTIMRRADCDTEQIFLWDRMWRNNSLIDIPTCFDFVLQRYLLKLAC